MKNEATKTRKPRATKAAKTTVATVTPTEGATEGPVVAASYWESDYKADLAALDAKFDGEFGEFLVPTQVKEAAKMLLCLLEEKPYEIPTRRAVDEFEIRTPETIRESIGDTITPNPGESYKATKAAIRLLRESLCEIEVRLCEQVLWEENWLREKLQRLEGTGVLAECETVATRRDLEAVTA